MPKRGVHVELEGQDDLRRAFRRLEIGALREAKDAVRVSAEEMEMEAKARAPVGESGEVKESIYTKYRELGLQATIGSGYYVARFHEFGTVKMNATPFINPAFQLVRPKYLRRLAEALDTAGRRASV